MSWLARRFEPVARRYARRLRYEETRSGPAPWTVNPAVNSAGRDWKERGFQNGYQNDFPPLSPRSPLSSGGKRQGL